VHHSWRCIKHDFLHHFNRPRCDLLVWVLVSKLVPSYYHRLDQILVYTSQYWELLLWQKDLKQMWQKLEKRPITLPLNDACKPDVMKWVCMCPAFATNRFLICKHLIQGVHHTPPLFFVEVKRNRTVPFQRHELLKALDSTAATIEEQLQSTDGDSLFDEDEIGSSNDDNGDDNNNNNTLDLQRSREQSGFMFEEAMNAKIDTITEFAQGLRYQIQVRDEHMLRALQREGASFLCFGKACLSREKRVVRGTDALTWQKLTSSAIFYCTWPAASDANPC
jgi:hypothetical protein